MRVEKADVRRNSADLVQLLGDFAPAILPVDEVDDSNFIEIVKRATHSDASSQGAGGRDGVSAIVRNRS